MEVWSVRLCTDYNLCLLLFFHFFQCQLINSQVWVSGNIVSVWGIFRMRFEHYVIEVGNCCTSISWYVWFHVSILYLISCSQSTVRWPWLQIPLLSFRPATDKVALLIGNLNYSHHPDLMAPTMDVHEMANLLQQLGFRVVSLLDLTREEMLAAIDKFLLLLDRGVYGEFNTVQYSGGYITMENVFWIEVFSETLKS